MATLRERTQAGAITVSLFEESGCLYSDWRQAGRRSLLDTVQAIRNDRRARTLPWGRAELEIPEVDLHFLKKANPDLDSRDGEIKRRAWRKFLGSPESLPYRTRGRGRFHGRSVGGL